MGFLTKTWNYEISVPYEKTDQVIKFCETNIGPRIFNTPKRKAGKFWMIHVWPDGDTTLQLDDEKFATFIRLIA